MRRTLIFAPSAMSQLRRIDRRFVQNVWTIIDNLLENPDAVSFDSNPYDPSIYNITIGGDIVISFEILDEQHAIRIVDIEDE